MTRFAAPLVLLLVTTLLYAYGHHAWSWLGGPVAALAIWWLGRAGEPAGNSLLQATPQPSTSRTG